MYNLNNKSQIKFTSNSYPTHCKIIVSDILICSKQFLEYTSTKKIFIFYDVVNCLVSM
jgi:hypothetical protein